MKEKDLETPKTNARLASRSRITRAQDEAVRIRRRLARLDAQLLQELGSRIRDADAALLHVREVVSLLDGVRALRGRG